MSGPAPPLRVGVTAARKGAELATAFERRGAMVVHAPTLAGDVPAADDEVGAALDQLAARTPTWFVASTGTGMKLLAEVAQRTGRMAGLTAALADATVVARGAKARGALQRLGHSPHYVAPSETDAEVVTYLTSRVSPDDVVAVQTHGAGGHPYGQLLDRGAQVVALQTYVSAPLPEPDRAEGLVRAVAAGALDVVTFTSPGAVHGLFHVADRVGIADAVSAALHGPVAIAAVGPVTAAAVREHATTVTVAPDEPRTGALVRAVMAWAENRSGP